MKEQDLGALVVHPAVGHDLWAVVVLVGAMGVAIAGVGLVRGRLGPRAAFAGLAVIPAVAALLGNIVIMQESTSVEFCGSCHVTMSPIVKSVRAEEDTSLASIHYTRGAVTTGEACYECHSGYGIWGGLEAKTAGNLTDDEKRSLERVLHELRMQFVAATGAVGASPPPSEAPPGIATP